MTELWRWMTFGAGYRGAKAIRKTPVKMNLKTTFAAETHYITKESEMQIKRR